MTLSVIIITKNEEANIERCLSSVTWTDEVIVVDSGSTDRTIEIARRFTSHVHEVGWHGFGPQKNLALSFATGDWVLSLDADEWVTDDLRTALTEAVAADATVSAWRMPRSSTFCGRVIHHSGWSPDYVTRLFRRGPARFSDDLVHERLIVDGRMGTLRAALLHESYRSLEQVLEKMNLYSTLSARDMQTRGRRASLISALAKGAWAFLRTYVLRRGFLDGREGFLIALATAESTFYRYMKLVYLAEGIPSDSPRPKGER